MTPLVEAVFWISLAAVAYSYAGYPVVLAIFSRWFGRPVTAGDGPLPSVAVVVPAHNEEKVIGRKIDNVLGQNYPADKLSVWIGSDMSTDATVRVVREKTGPRVKLWEAPQRVGKTGVLNALVPQTGADVVVFTDANTLHASDAIRNLVRPLGNPAVGGVAGHIDHTVQGRDTTGETMYRSFEARQKEMESRLHSTISAFGGFYAIRRNLFRAIPANAYSNDDVIIPMHVVRQGFRMVYEPLARSSEDFTHNVKIEFSRRIRIGAGNFQSFFWLLDFLSPFRGWPWFCYVSHKVTRWFSPLLLIAAGVAGALLAWGNPLSLYGGVLIFVAASMALASLHAVLPWRPAHYLYYFYAMNLALALGLMRYLRGIRSAAWTRPERASVPGVSH